MYTTADLENQTGINNDKFQMSAVIRPTPQFKIPDSATARRDFVRLAAEGFFPSKHLIEAS